MPLQPFYGATGHSRSLLVTDTAGSSTDTQVTTSATAFVNSSITQVIASTAFDTTGLYWVLTTNVNATATRVSTLVDIMIGASGSEQMLIGPISVGGHINRTSWFFPIYVPAGSRISMRARSAQTNFAVSGTVTLVGPANGDTVGLPQRWVTYGLSDDGTANAQGTLLSGTAVAYGSWTSLTSATTYAHDLWMPVIDVGTATSRGSHYGWIQTTLDTGTNGTSEDTANTSRRAPVYDIRSSGLSATWPGGQTTSFPFAFGSSPNSPIYYAPKPAGTPINARLFATVTTTNFLGISMMAGI